MNKHASMDLICVACLQRLIQGFRQAFNFDGKVVQPVPSVFVCVLKLETPVGRNGLFCLSPLFSGTILFSTKNGLPQKGSLFSRVTEELSYAYFAKDLAPNCNCP